MNRSTAVVATITGALLVGAVTQGAGLAAGATAKPSPRSATVKMKNIDYRPGTVTIRRGGKVTWVNQEIPKHTANFRGRIGRTGIIEEGKKKSLTFRKVGRFPYVCEYHPTMSGTVVVKAR